MACDLMFGRRGVSLRKGCVGVGFSLGWLGGAEGGK